jgi:hypothetical protein
LKIVKKIEDKDEYDLFYVICDFCSEQIITDNIKINHIFTPSSKIAPGHSIEVDICEQCFINKIYNELNYRTFE